MQQRAAARLKRLLTSLMCRNLRLVAELQLCKLTLAVRYLIEAAVHLG